MIHDDELRESMKRLWKCFKYSTMKEMAKEMGVSEARLRKFVQATDDTSSWATKARIYEWIEKKEKEYEGDKDLL